MKVSPLQILVLSSLAGLGGSTVNDEDWLVTDTEVVLDYRNNPILRPTEPFEWLMGDPTVVLIEEKEELHIFLNR